MDGKRDSGDKFGERPRSAPDINNAPSEPRNNDNYNMANNFGNINDQSNGTHGNDSATKTESNGSASKTENNALASGDKSGDQQVTVEGDESTANADCAGTSEEAGSNAWINNAESHDSTNNAEGNDWTNNAEGNDSTDSINKKEEGGVPGQYPEINEISRECNESADKNDLANNDDDSNKAGIDEGNEKAHRKIDNDVSEIIDENGTVLATGLNRNSKEGHLKLNTKGIEDNAKSDKAFASEAEEYHANNNPQTKDVDTNGDANDTTLTTLAADNHNETNASDTENVKKPKGRFVGRQLRYRIVKTGCLVTTWICIGLFTELSGPTFKDLELRMDLPIKEATEAVSRATSGRSLGFMAGAVIGGFLVDRFKRKGDLFIAISLCCASAFTVAVPWMSSFPTMWFMMFCQGTFEGIINIAGQEIILLLWGEKSAGPMHLLHFGFGMGSFINPLIAQPFLATKIVRNVTDLDNTTSYVTKGNETTVESLVGSRIEYAYLIAALITFIFSSTFFWYQYKGVPHGGYVEDYTNPKQTTKPVKTGCKQYISLIDPATCADGKRLAGFSIFALLFIYFFQAVGGERIYSKFIRNFALDQLGFSSSEASYLNSSFWISFSIGRFLGFVVAIWVPIRILIMVECFSGLGFAILLNFLGHNNKLALWVLTQPMSLFVAPLFPSGVAWSDHYLKMSGIGITVLIAGGSVGGAAYIWVIGYIYPNYGPRTFLYMVAVYSAAVCVSVSMMTFAGCLHGDRFQKERMEIEQEDPEADDNKAVTYVTSLPLEDL